MRLGLVPSSANDDIHVFFLIHDSLLWLDFSSICSISRIISVLEHSANLKPRTVILYYYLVGEKLLIGM